MSAIHDLGYKRYAGTRRPTSTRWRVIARHQLATAWKSWWRWKLVTVLTLIPIVVAAVWIFVLSDKLLGLGGSRGAGISITLADAALPTTFASFCSIAFVASVVLGTSIIAGDVRSGAFVFYFARSTRPIDYLLGKVVGYGAVIASVLAIGPLLVAIMHVALTTTSDTSALLDQIAVVPKALGLGLLGALAYTAIPLGFSAMVSNRGYALGLWAAYYLIVGNIATGFGAAGNLGWVKAIDLKNALVSLANHAFHMPAMLDGKLDVPTSAAVISLVAQSAIAIGLVYYKLSTAQKAGVGGAT
ncbi:MAG TPA: hypothetical protein VGG28_28545 [Kofleriaceae bacterium]|jgi:hypothetical protein